ncbi:hypothetical protein KFZ58_02385 [Virgibacillus sp. NKC19-16]|jgi:hypothetical protein|uniref:hypothetical protein n=1 Tax=Virgibacillus salidurans TaxID=2831673 RepID=UPI001F1A406C|nr:hypothetical protein [Virgibacillus sp. NKC19-16]UJL46821.1 hypothetical protein KFZ58_02385 [Virgibacillus sp. NKC19-16]
MKQVELMNRSMLEQRLDSEGMIEATEKVIERMKEHVRSMVVHLHEVFLVDVRLMKNELLETIRVAFTTTENEDPLEDREIDQPVNVVFLLLEHEG